MEGNTTLRPSSGPGSESNFVVDLNSPSRNQGTTRAKLAHSTTTTRKTTPFGPETDGHPAILPSNIPQM